MSVAARRLVGPDALLSAYAVFLLLIPSTYTIGSFALTASMVVGLVAGGLWCAGLLIPDSRSRPPTDPASFAVLAYSGLMVVSYLLAMLRPLNSTASSGADRHLAGLMSIVGASLLAAAGLRHRQEIYRVLGVLVSAGGALALIGIVQYVSDVDPAKSLRPPGFAAESAAGFVLSRAGLDRVAGTTRHPIEFGIVCAMLLPIAVHLSAHAARRAGRGAAMLAAVLLGIALPMALSRAAVAGAIVAMAIVLPGLPSVRRWRLLAGIGMVLWSVTLLTPAVLTTTRDLFVGEAATGSDTARAKATEAAIDRFAEEPWFGHGFGTLQGIIVDNQILVTIVESGIAGIVGLVILVNGAVFAARKARQATNDDGLRDLGSTLIAVVAAVLVGSSGLATLVYPTTSGLLFLAIGLCGAMYRLSTTDHAVGLPGAAAVDLVPART